MNLKNAAFLALVAMILLTILVAADFINVVLGVARDLLPSMALVRSLIYTFASICVTVFLYVFYKTSR